MSVTFKPSRLAKVLERNEMTKKKEKAWVAAGVGAAADRRGNIRSILQAAVVVQATEEGQMATSGKRKATIPRDQQPAKRTAQGYQEEEWKTMDAIMDMRNLYMDKSIGLTPKQVAIAMGIIAKGINDLLKQSMAAKEMARSATGAAEAAANKKWEKDRCRWSILIHNADKWVGNNSNGFSLAEAIMAQIQEHWPHCAGLGHLPSWTVGGQQAAHQCVCHLRLSGAEGHLLQGAGQGDIGEEDWMGDD